MGTFTSKPAYIDFGAEASTQKVRFQHNYATLTVADYPEWISSVSIDYDATKGTLTAVAAIDNTIKRVDGVIEITANDGVDDFTHYIQVIFSYSSEFIPINNVIDNLMMMTGDSSYVTERDRMSAKIIAKKWLADYRGAAGNNIRFAEIAVDGFELNPPADFVDYLGLYAVSSDGFLKPLYHNDNINRAEGYMEDQNDLFLLDQNGFVLSGYGLTKQPQNHNPYTYYGTTISELGTNELAGLYYNIRAGEYSANGIYNYDRAGRRFVLDGVSDSFLVLKYISDPLIRDKMNIESGGIKVHKNYEDALMKHIYSELLNVKMNVPEIVKSRALREYSKAMKRASFRDIKWEELVQSLRGNNRYFSTV